MSYDVFVWHAPAVDDPEAAFELIEAVSEGDHEKLTASPEVEAFLAELFAEYPPLGESESPQPDTPWSFTDDTSDRHALLSIQAGAPHTVMQRVVQLAEHHGLHCFDPQSGDFYS